MKTLMKAVEPAERVERIDRIRIKAISKKSFTQIPKLIGTERSIGTERQRIGIWRRLGMNPF